MRKSYWIIALALISIMITLGCGELGKVDQGRVIQFDKTKKTVTLIRDKSADPQKPDYSYLPPITYTLPVDLQEMGPDPKVGLRMKLDIQKKQIVIFDPSAQNFKTIPYTLLDQKEKINKEDPLVYDKDKDKPKKFPVIDRAKEDDNHLFQKTTNPDHLFPPRRILLPYRKIPGIPGMRSVFITRKKERP